MRLTRSSSGAPFSSEVLLAVLVALLLVAGTLGLAGVGTGRGKGGPAGGTLTERDGGGAVDQRRAVAIVLRPDDFPAGWEKAPDTDGDFREGFAAGAAGADCPGVRDPTAGRLSGTARSSFTRPGRDFAYVGSYAGVAASRGLAEKAFRLVSSRPFLDCAVDAFVDGFIAEAGQGFVLTPRPAEPLGTDGEVDQVAGRRVRFVARRAGAELDVYLDLVALRSERAVVLTVVGAIPVPLDPDLAHRLVERLASRMMPSV